MMAPEQTCMQLTTNLLRLLGSWPQWKNMDKFSEKWYLGYTIFACSFMAIYVMILGYGFTGEQEWTLMKMPTEDIIVFSTGTVWMVVWFAAVGGRCIILKAKWSLLSLGKGLWQFRLPFTGPGLISFLKMIMLIRNQRQIQEVIDYINFNLNKKYVRTESDRKIILDCVRHERILIKLYVGLAGVMVLLFTGSSLIKMTEESWTDNYDTKLPLKYTFKINNFSLFIACYFHQVIVMILNGEVGTLADAVFSCLVYYVCGHLTIVKNRFLLQNMYIDKNCLNYHKKILRLITRVEQIFEKFLIFMISVNSFLICLGLLQITQGSDTKRLSYEKSLVYLSIKLSQLFLYCWYGQEITERSAEVSFACYSTQWYAHLGERNSLDFRFVLHRTQKPVQMRAGYFFTASILTLKSVMNTAYSFFTMLNSVRK